MQGLVKPCYGEFEMITGMRKRNSGFTLIELVIAVAIVGILAAIAYPSYQESVRKSRRAEGRAVLMELAQYMERNYTVANRYDQDRTGNAIALPFDESPANAAVGDRDYAVTLSNLTASTFQLNAAPNNGHTGDKCGTLTLTQTGVRGVTSAHAGVTAGDCW